MVVTEEARATHVGVEILERGGNAVDAAVAVGFALAVTLAAAPAISAAAVSCWCGSRNEQPDRRHRLSRDGAGGDDATTFSSTRMARPIRKSRASRGLRVGVPGTVAGLALALEKYGSGKFTLAELIAPAIALAREGIVVDARACRLRSPRSQAACSSAGRRRRRFFFAPTARALERGERLVQRDLAETLEAIARDGPRRFLRRADRREDRAQRAGGGRRHDARRISPITRGRARRRCAAIIAATISSRCRRRRRAACI